MRRKDIIVGVVIALFGAFLLWESVVLRYYTPLGPGPGFFGVWIGVAELLIGVSLVVSALRAEALPLPVDFWPVRKGWVRLAIVVAALAWMALFFETLGYIVTSFVMLTVLTISMGNRKPLLVLATAAIGSFGVWFLFTDLLQTRLPRGVFGI